MIFFYLPGIALVHFVSAAALGAMSILSGKALTDMRPARRSRHDDLD